MAKFPHAILNTSCYPPTTHIPGVTKIWIGGILYVDDLAILTTCPLELQYMLHVCQSLSIQHRMQINTGKTKMMAFFESPAKQRARGGKHQPSPNLTPYHMHAPFP